jgi:hypothetical protein
MSTRDASIRWICESCFGTNSITSERQISVLCVLQHLAPGRVDRSVLLIAHVGDDAIQAIGKAGPFVARVWPTGMHDCAESRRDARFPAPDLFRGIAASTSRPLNGIRPLPALVRKAGGREFAPSAVHPAVARAKVARPSLNLSLSRKRLQDRRPKSSRGNA